MSIKAAGFAYTSTTTPGKIQAINWQKFRVRQRWMNQPMTGYGVCIPGGGMQLDRHITELLDYGVDQTRQIMVDRNRSVVSTLKAAAKNLGFKGQIICGDMFDVIQDLWDAGDQVDVIDHDNTKFVTNEHLAFLEKACENHVKVYIEVFQTRGNRGGLPYELSQWAKTLGIKQYVHRRGNLAWPWGDIQSGAVEYTANNAGYDHFDYPYKGLVTMRTNIMFPQ